MNTFRVREIVLFLLLVVAISFTTGCKKGDPRSKDLVPAMGTITYNGTPLDGATLTFLNEEDPLKPGGSAVSKADGTFAVSLYGDGDGTSPGNYVVTVTKIEMKSKLSEEEILDYEKRGEELPADAQEEVALIPKKYGSKTTSDIHVAIPAGGDKAIQIDLKD